MLEPSATGMYTPQFCLENDADIDNFLESREFKNIITIFTHRVVSVHKGRGSAKLWKD